MFKYLAVSLLFVPIFAGAEDLSGPPDIFVPEDGAIYNEAPLPFAYGELPALDEDVSATVEAQKELLEEKSFSSSFNFINRRTNVVTPVHFASGDDVQLVNGFQFKVFQCLSKLDDVYDNDAAFVEISTLEGANVLFSGWVYKKRPSMHAFEHPLYSMAFLGCK